MHRMVLALLSLLFTFAASADTFEDLLVESAIKVRREIVPVRGRSTVVGVVAPSLDLSSALDNDRAAAAFEKVFLNELHNLTRAETGINYRDEHFYPALERIFREEFIRLRDNPDLVRRMINPYYAEGTYDYLVLTRMYTRSGRIHLEHVVVRPSGLERIVMNEMSEDIHHGEGWRFGVNFSLALTTTDTAVTFRDTGGQLVSLSNDSQFDTAGVELELKSDRWYGHYGTRRQREDTGTDTGQDFITDVDDGGVEGIVARGRRNGILLGYHFRKIEEGIGSKTVDDAVFVNEITQHHAVLGIVHGNLHNGVSLSAIGRVGDSTDTTVARQFGSGDDEMWTDEGVLARLLWNRTSSRNELRFVVAGGRVRYDYNIAYYGQAFTADYDIYEAEFRYRFRFGENFRAGVIASHRRLAYRQNSGGTRSFLADDTHTVLGVEIGAVLVTSR